MDDVNSGAINPATSSVAQGPETQSVQQTPNPTPSAGTLNTDAQEYANGQPIPYERFREINSKYRAAEEQLNSLRQNYGQYERFEQLLSTYPQLAEYIQQGVAQIVGRGQQQPQNQVYQQQPEQMQQPQQAVNFDPVVRERIYVDEFKALAKSKGVPDGLMNQYMAMAYSAINHINPDPLVNFNPAIIPQVFDYVHDVVNTLVTEHQKGYIQQKNNDVTPPSTSSQAGFAPVQTAPRALNQQSIAEYLKNEFRAAGLT